MWILNVIFCLFSVFAQPQISVLSTGNFSRAILSTADDGGSPVSSDWTTISSVLMGGLSSRFAVWRFVNVQVPQGASVLSATLQTSVAGSALCITQCGYDFSADASDNSLPLPPSSYNFPFNRSLTTAFTKNFKNGIIEVSDVLGEVITKRSGWMYGNNLTILALSQTCSACGLFGSSMSVYLFPYVAKLSIRWNKTTLISRVATDVLQPSRGNWDVTNSYYPEALDTNALSIGIGNVSIAGAIDTMVVELDVTSAKLSAIGMGNFSCTNSLPSVMFPSKNLVSHTCDLPCVAGANYLLNLTYCWIINQTLQVNDGLSAVHQFASVPTCFQVVPNGRFEFAYPVMLNATMLPYDGRPYSINAGKLNVTGTTQSLNDRNVLLTTFGALHICPDDRWLTIFIGNANNQYLLKCSLDSAIQPAPPAGAVNGYTTVACLFPACNQTMCPGGFPMSLTMSYAGVISRGSDVLVYPTLPVVSQVAGCFNNSGSGTSQCPTEGGVRINITMVEDPGWSTSVSVLVGGASCPSVFIYPFVVTCLLPPGVGLLQTVLVLVSGYVSPPVNFVSYMKPIILNVSGGLGCTVTNESDPILGVSMCNRNGSTSVPLILTGQNFGAIGVPISVTLRGVPIHVDRNSDDPHHQLFVSLPAGLGAQLSLGVTVALQSDYIVISYEPCSIGTDEMCLPCGIGSFGILPPSCVLCPAGRYQALTGQSDCTFCPKGTFQPAPGRHDCVSCPVHMTSLGVGSSEIAACSACPITHYLAVEGDDHVCTPCAPNSVPVSDGGCGCNVGYYDSRVEVAVGEEEQLECDVCPDGGNCQLPGTSFKTMGPLQGWWRSDEGTMLQCIDALDCLGVAWGYYSFDNATSSCANHRSGVLCAECDVGFQPSNVQGGTCVPCDSSALAWLWVSLILVLLAIGVTGVGFWFHRRKKIRNQRERENQHAVVLSKSTSSLNNFEKFTKQVDDNSNISNNSSGSSGSSSSMSNMNIGGSRARAQTEIVSVATTKKKQNRAAMVSTVKIVVGFLQILSSITNTSIQLPSAFMEVMRVFSFLNFDFLPWASIRCVFNIDFYTRIYVGCLYPFAVVFLLLVFVALPIMFIDKRDYQDEGVARRFRAQFLNQTGTLVMFCLFLLYPWITLQLLQFGICLRVDERYYLLADMKEQCFVGAWMFHLGPVIVLFLLLSVGIPVSLGIVLYRSRHKLRTEKVRERLGFLYQSYAYDCWWFEIVEMSVKVALISIVRFFDPSIHAPLRMGVCYLYIVVVLLKKPYISDSLDNLALLCMAELMMFSLLAHVLPLVGRWQGTYVDDILSAILLTLSLMLFLYFLFILIKSTRLLLRHPLVRKLLTKSAQPSRLRVATQFGALFDQQSSLVNSFDESDSSVSHGPDSLDLSKDPKNPNRSARPISSASSSFVQAQPLPSQKAKLENMPPPYVEKVTDVSYEGETGSGTSVAHG